MALKKNKKRFVFFQLKLGFINERPENASAPSWSETGDRYVLKLFRDYLFHQRLPDGTPVIDCGHVISSLNKLDAGEPEEIIMSSRNGKDLLIANYSDIHRCIDDSFVELSLQADPTTMPHSLEEGGGYAGSMSMDPYFVPLNEPTSAPNRYSSQRAISDPSGDVYGRGRGGRGSGGRSSSRGGGRGRGSFSSGRGPPPLSHQRSFPGVALNNPRNTFGNGYNL
jgi:hypothetical protein